MLDSTLNISGPFDISTAQNNQQRLYGVDSIKRKLNNGVQLLDNKKQCFKSNTFNSKHTNKKDNNGEKVEYFIFLKTRF